MVMLLSYFFLSISYKFFHFIGVVVCLFGFLIIIYSDGSGIELGKGKFNFFFR